jgi:primosomal protein N'
VVIALGLAARTLLKTDARFSAARPRLDYRGGASLIPTFIRRFSFAARLKREAWRTKTALSPSAALFPARPQPHQSRAPVPSERMSERVEGPMRLIQVAVPVPQIDPLTYSVPDEFPDPIPGVRVLVSVGKRTMTGVVITTVIRDPGSGIRDVPNSTDSVRADPGPRIPDHGPWIPDPGSRTPDPGNIKPIIDILDSTAFLPPDVLTLAMWVAEYYACGAGEAIAAAMPPRAWIESDRHAHITDTGRARLAGERGARRQMLAALDTPDPARVEAIIGKAGSHATLVGLERDGLIEITQPLRGQASAYRTVRVASLTALGHDAADAAPKLGPRRGEALALLTGAPDGIDTSELGERGITAATVAPRGARSHHHLARRVERDPFEREAGVSTTPRVPKYSPRNSPTPQIDCRRLPRRGFRTALLHGVTGAARPSYLLSPMKFAEAARCADARPETR